MRELSDLHHLLHDDDGVVRVPFVVRGRLVAPPAVDKQAIVAAFAAAGEGATALPVGEALVVREPIIDRATMNATGEWQYQVMARVEPLELLSRDAHALKPLYDLPFSEVLAYLRGLGRALVENAGVVQRVRELSRRTAPHPDLFHDAAFAAFPLVLSPEVAAATVDRELAYGGRPGRDFLDGWVELDETPFPGMTSFLAQALFGRELPAAIGPTAPSIRALPTRQLHITAGNAPAVPVFSLLRALATKSPAVIKSPYGAIMPGALAALAALSFAPDHPITRHLSIVYWRGGDAAIEDVLLAPMAFDRVVVWGAPDAVRSVQARAGLTRVLSFNPRYGLSLIGREAFAGDLRPVAIRASLDTMIWSQKACTASFVHYVEGSAEDAARYGEVLAGVLAEWDRYAPAHVPPSASAAVRRMKRGKYPGATWRHNASGGGSTVMVLEGKFDMLDHPMSRLVVVRRVDDLADVLATMHHGVAAIGVYPEGRRLELRDLLGMHGVSNVLPLGQVERSFGGMPHDGMRALADLVDWKHG
jgi:hypothetical protein